MVKHFWRSRVWENSLIKNSEKKINKIKLIEANSINDEIIYQLNH